MARRPPVALDSERAAIGAAISDGEFAEIVSAELTPVDLYDENARKAYIAIHSLIDDNLTPGTIAVQERSGLTESVIEEFREKARGTTRNSLKTIISEIKRISLLRSIYTTCSDTVHIVSKESKIEDILDNLEKGLFRLDRSGASEAKEGGVVLKSVVEDFVRRTAEGGGAEISTGLKELDKAIIGLRPGKMIVIAARPSMGKTALADTIRRAVVKQGYGAIQFSLEMSAEEILEREIAFQASLNLRKVIAAKELTDAEIDRVKAIPGLLDLDGRWFIDDRTYSISGIRRRSRILASRMVRQGVKLGCIILDYIQLAGENGDNREQSVAAISRGCKLLAKELGCTVLALSQLNRSCESREDRRPMMSDLRESGAIEQDADIVGFVYRDCMYNAASPEDEAEFIIRKHRSGPTGLVRLRYNGRLVCFSDTVAICHPPITPVTGTQNIGENGGTRFYTSSLKEVSS